MGADESVARINQELASAHVPVTVRLSKGGGSLLLRATLPCKPNDGEGKKRYEIGLGIKANADGFKRIRAEAHKLGSLITLGKFSWAEYQPELYGTIAQAPPPERIKDAVKRFQVAYMAEHRIKRRTWDETWARTFAKMPQDYPLDEAILLEAVLLTESHTRTREQTCQRLQALANFAGLAVDLGKYKGDYSDRDTKPRDLPTDENIARWRDKIVNSQWQWVYGMMAAFGLRPHEAFFCQFVGDELKILEGKTDGRLVAPIFPEWAERWNLKKINRPNCSGRDYRDYGQRTYTAFKRLKVPTSPYNLRHCYAIRGTVILGLPDTTMASFMGHSPDVHKRVYHRWIRHDQNRSVYERLVLNSTDRPQAP